MKRSLQVALPPMEVKAVVPTTNAEDSSLVLKRRWLRDAIDESGWKHEAVACALDVDGPYLSKMLAGEKPITLRHLDRLPDDIEAIYLQKYTEALGLIVVAPSSGPDAVKHLVAGLIGMLTSLPRRVA